MHGYKEIQIRNCAKSEYKYSNILVLKDVDKSERKLACNFLTVHTVR